MTFLHLAKSRSSVRKFKPDPVKEEDLNYILEVGTCCSFSSKLPAMAFPGFEGKRIA